MQAPLELEIHALERRFASLRVHNPRRLAALVRAIERSGQLTPVVVVPHEKQAQRWVLIDGYLRVEALGRLGKDLVWADGWTCSLDEALLKCLARGTERAWEAIEEAALLHELSARYALRELARHIGRDVSWVSRRLALFTALPESMLEAVREGKLSLWAATRILTPLARANTEHAERLLEHLQHNPLSTRALKRLYEHYQKANRTQRTRIIENPALFLKTLESHEQTGAERRLADGPEGRWCQELARVAKTLKGLVQQVPIVLAPDQVPAERARLREAFEATQKQFSRLEKTLKEHLPHDPVRNPTGHRGTAQQRGADPTDQPTAQALAQHGARGPEKPSASTQGAAGAQAPADHLAAARAVLGGARQRRAPEGAS